MSMLLSAMRGHRAAMLLTFLAPCVFLPVFILYGYNAEPFLYASALYLLIWLACWIVTLTRVIARHRVRTETLREALNGGELSLAPCDLASGDYLVALRQILRKMSELESQTEAERTDTRNYYSLWTHQIKTPIAVMRMLLQSGDCKEKQALLAELLRVEQYAEMALGYIRLEDGTADLVYKETDLDEVIRTVIRRLAPLFIARGLAMDYEGTDARIVTDSKWLGFILEQLLSNAVKYTPSGRIGIEVHGDLCITVRDTGIGIAPQDLPRIFEKGFTGRNGRADLKATGIGLYLCKMAARKLNARITAESEPGHGSAFTLKLCTERPLFE